MPSSSADSAVFAAAFNTCLNTIEVLIAFNGSALCNARLSPKPLFDTTGKRRNPENALQRFADRLSLLADRKSPSRQIVVTGGILHTNVTNWIP